MAAIVAPNAAAAALTPERQRQLALAAAMTAAVAAPDDGSGGGPGAGASTVEYTCPICGYASSDKHCFHYGGVSCYSCRAFFRRAHQGTKSPSFRCKKEGDCEVTVKTRRKCQACRYDRCLRAGMDPQLVLSEDQKKIRFRNYLKKKEAVAQLQKDGQRQQQQQHRQQLVASPAGSDDGNNRSSSNGSSSSGSHGNGAADNLAYILDAVVAKGHRQHNHHPQQQQQQQQHVLYHAQRRQQHLEHQGGGREERHVFGASLSEASYMPVIASLARQQQQQQEQRQRRLEFLRLRQHQHQQQQQGQQMQAPVLPYFQRHLQQHYSSQHHQEHEQQDHQQQQHDSNYLNSLRAHATILAQRHMEHTHHQGSQDEKRSDIQVGHKRHWSQGSISPPPVDHIKRMFHLAQQQQQNRYVDQEQKEEENLEEEVENKKPRISPSPPMLDVDLLHKIEQVRQLYYMAMCQISWEPEYIECMHNLYKDEEDLASAPLPTREHLSSHIFKVTKQFRAFALSLPTFRQLSRHDQNLLLYNNSAAFFAYTLMRCMGSETGEEQLDWMLGMNQPQNLSMKRLRRISFEEFNDKVMLVSKNVMEQEAENIQKTVHSISEVGILREHTCLVAQLLLFKNLNSLDIHERSIVQANFIEALELLKQAHQTKGIDVPIGSILKMIDGLHTMVEGMANWNLGLEEEPLPHIPFLKLTLPVTAAEEQWMQHDLLWMQDVSQEVPLTLDLASKVVALGSDHESSPSDEDETILLPEIMALFRQRVCKMAQAHPGLADIGAEEQRRLLDANSTTCLGIMLAELIAAPSLLAQMEVLVGCRSSSSTYCGVDLEGLKPLSLSRLGASVGPRELKAFRHLATKVGAVTRGAQPAQALLVSAALAQDVDGGSESACRSHSEVVQTLERHLAHRRQSRRRRRGSGSRRGSRGSLVEEEEVAVDREEVADIDEEEEEGGYVGKALEALRDLSWIVTKMGK